MSTIIDESPRLGEGIYTLPQAARLLTRRERLLTPQKVRYWLNSGLVPASYEVDNHALLTFLDLISLEVVARFVEAGWSVQGVRKVEEVLRDEFRNLERPFAYAIFYTDGRSVWSKKVDQDPDDHQVLELIGKKARKGSNPLAWAEAVQSFAEEIRFKGPHKVAAAWDLSPWIEINPEIQFGAPVVRGTRVPIDTVLANLQVGSPGEVADWYDLTLDEVQGVRDYAAIN